MATGATTPFTPASPLVSIVINNRNYAAYLADAIDSALQQTYSRCEVIVVDDGSTDHSRDIMAGYGSRVLPVTLEWQGQAGACNAGFAQSRGAVVIFLDADDVLLPRAVERVVHGFRNRPDAAKVQCRLEIIDRHGAPTGRFIPSASTPLPNGDLRRQVLDHGDDLPWASTSGNAFPVWVLRRVMPIPTDAYPRIGVDMYLTNVVALFGPVVSIDEVGARYRVHGQNAFHRSGLDVEQSRTTILLSRETHRQLRRLAADAGVPLAPGRAVGANSLTLLAHRMVLAKFDIARPSIGQETPRRVAIAGVAAAVRRRDRPVRLRVAYAGWFMAMAIVPRSVGQLLTQRLFAG